MFLSAVKIKIKIELAKIKLTKFMLTHEFPTLHKFIQISPTNSYYFHQANSIIDITGIKHSRITQMNHSHSRKSHIKQLILHALDQ